jgi:hypothetical protein
MAFLHSGHNSKIRLSANEMLGISQEISRDFTPCFLSLVPEPAEKIRLSSKELLDIGEEIGRDFAPKLSCNAPEVMSGYPARHPSGKCKSVPDRFVMLLPVDPGHLYAYWNLGENREIFSPANDDNDQLTLRVYSQPEEESAASETASWFDVAIGRSMTHQQVSLPNLADHMVYSAAIGQRAADHGFIEFAHSNVIHAHGGQTAWHQDPTYGSNKNASGLGISQ